VPADRSALLFESTLAGVFRLDAEGRLLKANRALARMLGYASVEEILAAPARPLAPLLEQPLAVGAEVRLERRDGSPFWALASVERSESGARGALFEITRYKLAEQRLVHLNRLYAVLSHLDQAVVRCSTERDLLEAACRIAVDDGGFRMAWIGFVEAETGRVRPAASAGAVDGYLDGIEISAADTPLGCGPTGRAIRAGRHFISNDISVDEALGPWRERALERGYRSSGAFPVRLAGDIVGALSLYTSDCGLFDSETVDLLQEVADDVGFALESMRRERQRDQAEKERARLEVSEQSARSQAKAETRFRVLLEAAPDAVLEIDRRGQILLMNVATERLFGYSREELLGQQLETLLPEPLREAHVALRNAYLENPEKRPVAPGSELMARRKDGSVFPVEVSLSPVESEGGQLVTCIVRDVTLRRRAERAEKESSRQIASILESITDSFFALDRQWRFTYLNRRAEQAIGRRREELIGKNIWEELPAFCGTPFYKEYHRAARNGAPVEFSAPIPPGALWASVHVYPSNDGLSVYMQDITERKLLEEQFLQSQKLEALGRLAGGVAHDFNNLLTIIGGYGQMVVDSLPKRSPMRKDMDAVLEAANRASALTRQLLAFSRRQMVQPKVFDLNRLVKKMNRMLLRMIGEDVDLQLSLQASPGRVKADPSQIEQVLMNLAVNARDAMPQGGRLSIGTSELALEKETPGVTPELPEGRYVVLTVADNGVGMDASVRSRIFEPFFTTKPKGKGTGLGLATVYGIVKQSGGDILVESEPGKGAAFKICLPRVELAPKAARKAPHPHAPLRGAETVLLVEDDPEVLRLTRDMLASQGYKVLEASGGEEAVRVWESVEGAVDLLLTDVIMPQMSGPQLAQRLLERKPGLRVLYMSGYTIDAIAQRGGVDHDLHLLAKPFTREALGTRIRRLLDHPTRPAHRATK
jgi:PAS domain S-box-containing protein